MKAEGRLEDAVQAYHQAVCSDAPRADAWRFLGNAWYNQREYQHALEAYLASARIDPGEVKVWMNLGNTFERLGWFTQSIGAFREATRVDPTLIQAKEQVERLEALLPPSEPPTSSLDRPSAPMPSES
jgi:tetratricopeptide (TPR) repeat protein